MSYKLKYVKIFIDWYGDKMEKREVPLKNYLILLVLTIGIVCLVFYLASWYNTTKEYYKNNSILSKYLPEVKSEEISSFLVDNPEIVIYYASAKDENIKSFEKTFKKMIEKYEINDDIIYIDSSKEENVNFTSELNKIMDKKLDSIAIPNLIYIKNGSINRILYNKSSKINEREVRNFLIRCGVIVND